VELFVREYGPADAPAVVFLHGGLMSGWSWAPVVERLPQYRCLVPDLPQYGGSRRAGPFRMARAAAAVAELIGERTTAGRAHLVGFSLGAQVVLQLLAGQPHLVDRAVLAGAFVNTMPAARLVRDLADLLARTATVRWLAVNRHWAAHGTGDDARLHSDAQLGSGTDFAHIARASAGFTVPPALADCPAPTLVLTGGAEPWFVRHSARVLGRTLPAATARVATGMQHNWPLQWPDRFARTVTDWIAGAELPGWLEPLMPVGERAARRRGRRRR